MSIATYYSSFALESLKKKQKNSGEVPPENTNVSSSEDKPKRGRKKKNDVHSDSSK